MLYSKSMKPVALPPGRARLSTKPAPTGSTGDREHDRHGAGRLQQRPHGRGAMGQDDVGRERGQFRRVSANLGGIGSWPSGCRSARCGRWSSPTAPAPAGTPRRGPEIPHRPRLRAGARRCAARARAAARARRAATSPPCRQQTRNSRRLMPAPRLRTRNRLGHASILARLCVAYELAVARAAHVRFSNRPFGVKRFQTIHHCSVDVAHGLVLLFGIGTKALPSWDSRTRRNNLLVGLAVRLTAGPSGHAISPHPSSREGHHSTARWSSSFLLSGLILHGSHAAAAFPGPPELGAVNPYAVHDHGQPARQRHDRLLHPAAPGDLHRPGLEP